jgi:hypothetical protein
MSGVINPGDLIQPYLEPYVRSVVEGASRPVAEKEVERLAASAAKGAVVPYVLAAGILATASALLGLRLYLKGSRRR